MMAFLVAAVLKLGTLAPDGSVWHRIVQELDGDLRAATGGKVKLRIYAGGVMGDEGDMVRKMRLGQLQAGGITGTGMADIAPGMNVLQMPVMVTEDGELGYLRDRLMSRFEKEMRAKGFVVVAWADGGWGHLFSNKPVSTLADLKPLKLWVWAKDGVTARVWKRAGMDPVNLNVADILPGLQTGMVDAFISTPLAVLSMQLHNHAKYMTGMRFGVVSGAIIITAKAFDALAPSEQTALMEAGKKATGRFVDAVEKESQKAIDEMKKRGLTVVDVPAEERKAWNQLGESSWKDYRGEVVPPDIFDEALKIRAEFRAQKK